MTALESLSHWRLERDADGLAWLIFDRAGSAVNALSADTMAELPRCWTRWTPSRPRAW